MPYTNRTGFASAMGDLYQPGATYCLAKRSDILPKQAEGWHLVTELPDASTDEYGSIYVLAQNYEFPDGPSHFSHADSQPSAQSQPLGNLLPIQLTGAELLLELIDLEIETPPAGDRSKKVKAKKKASAISKAAKAAATPPRQPFTLRGFFSWSRTTNSKKL